MDGLELLLSIELQDPLANVTDGWTCTGKVVKKKKINCHIKQYIQLKKQNKKTLPWPAIIDRKLESLFLAEAGRDPVGSTTLRLESTGVTGFEKFSVNLVAVLFFSNFAVAGGVAGGVFKCKELKFSNKMEINGKYKEAILAWWACNKNTIYVECLNI